MKCWLQARCFPAQVASPPLPNMNRRVRLPRGPMLCAGITTYSPLMRVMVATGDKIGVDGIGGLGHMAIKRAVSRGAEVYAFTTSPSKVDDIKGLGAKEVIVVDDLSKRQPHHGTLDYMISTIP